MAYGIYNDAALTRLTSSAQPKWFLLPAAGGTKVSTLYLGDPVSPLSTTATLSITPVGGDLTGSPPNLSVALGLHGTGIFGAPNAPLIFTPLNLTTPVAIDVQVICAAGALAEFTNWSLRIVGISGQLPYAYCAAFRADQGLAQSLRVVDPACVAGPVVGSMPGFIWGQSRWRDASEINQMALVPTCWDTDPADVGLEKFVSGIGAADDLLLVDLETTPATLGAVHPRVHKGEYFTGTNRHYLPADSAGDSAGYAVEVFPATSSFNLAALPRPQTPVFIGRWRMDDTGAYETDVSYRYIGMPYSATSPFDPFDSGPQYTLDRGSGAIALNHLAPSLPVSGTMFLGILPAGAPAQFNVPYYPIQSIGRVYAENPVVDATGYTFNAATGLLTLGGGSWSGLPMYADYVAAIAAVYELPSAVTDGSEDTRLVTSLDLNPATSGIQQGTLHMMRRPWQAFSLQLYADKPRLNLPSGSTGTVVFGPVFCEQDYALLVVTAYGVGSQDAVPGVRMRIVPGAGFEGLINYQDPTSQEVEVMTGGDGSASLIYLPPDTYGWWLSLSTSVSGNTLTLPTAVPAGDIYTALNGWSVLTYQVQDNDPYLGKVGAVVDQGEIAWVTTGTAGTVTYQTNGKRVLLSSGLTAVVPAAALDSTGKAIGAAGFNGYVSSLVYSAPLPVATNTGAYFVALAGQVPMYLESLDGSLQSNSIVLQLAPPVDASDQDPTDTLMPPTQSSYLLLDDVTGRLDVNRLAGAPIPGFTINQRIS